MKILKMAVAGAGYMGRSHIRILRSFKDVELVGVVEPQSANAGIIERIYGLKVYKSVPKLLSSQKIDAISIAVPTAYHYELGKYCLLRKIAVLMEKPIAATVSEGQGLVKLAEKTNAPFMVGHVERFNPAIVELKRRLTEGQLGKVFEIRAERMGPFPARISDVGVVVDLATHDIDIFEYLLGSRITKAVTRTRSCFHPRREDYVVSLLDFADGVTGILSVNWITPTKIRQLRVTGEKGMFLVNYLTQELFFYQNNSSEVKWEQMQIFKAVNEGDMIKIKVNNAEPLSVELRAFVDAVKSREEMPVKPEIGLRALEVATGILKKEIVLWR
ncbi:Gfo/Idh/MocA family oxidoreductase [Candidatus Collierbacteria bacterium]|nr:Gfo/Idh/MocA family oxidoreductase [Candidatus Collierbacteria bacterium]